MSDSTLSQEDQFLLQSEVRERIRQLVQRLEAEVDAD